MQRKRRRALPSSVARRGVAAGLITLALIAARCGGDGDTKTIATDPSTFKGSIAVSVASSLRNGFSEITRTFAETYDGGVSVDLNAGASTSVAEAILGGADADVFASADQFNMTKLQEAGLVFGDPTTFAHNKLVIVTKPGNPAGIKSAADLATAGVISLCTLEVPCGRYAAQALVSAKVIIDESRITRGQNVAATLDQVAEGDAVAGIVYVTDAQAKAEQVDTVALPDTQNVIAAYPIAAIGKAENEISKRFIAFVKSKTGQRILKKYGFLP